SFGAASAYQKRSARLEAVDSQFGIPASRVYYLAVPPFLIAPSVSHLRDAGMVHPAGDDVSFTRVIVEKPIGRDLDSAREILRVVGSSFDESQTYRIDHYLGKETVQNLLVLRFANSIFEPLWHAKYIHHVQITDADEAAVLQYDDDGDGM